MLGSQTLIAFVATVDSARARNFYEATLGLSVISDEPFALVMNANGTTIRMQKVQSFEPHPFTALGWKVDDIAVVVEALRDKGVVCERFPGLDQDGRGIWSSPSGARVAWFKDPDGNVLSLTEF